MAQSLSLRQSAEHESPKPPRVVSDGCRGSPKLNDAFESRIANQQPTADHSSPTRRTIGLDPFDFSHPFREMRRFPVIGQTGARLRAPLASPVDGVRRRVSTVAELRCNPSRQRTWAILTLPIVGQSTLSSRVRACRGLHKSQYQT